MSGIQFSQIHPRAFAHPSDQKATRSFEQVPFFPDLLRKVSEIGVEKRFRAHHMYHSLEVNKHQMPTIWRMVCDVSDKLGIQPPRTYITRQGGINAFAFGKHSHSIVLTTELVEMMSDEELKGVIAHEMGHILCQHMLFMDVGLALTSGTMPPLTKLVPGLEETVASLFFAWFRAAEYSADRAALLILEDPDPLVGCLTRLAGVPRRFEHEFDPRQFTEQVSKYEEEEANLWTKIITFGMGAFLTHPEPAKRVGAILDWSKSEQYRSIVSGYYLTRFEVEAQERIRIEGVASCPACGKTVGQLAVCPNCDLNQDPKYQQRCPRGHVNGSDWRFCIACGATLSPAATRSENPGS